MPPGKEDIMAKVRVWKVDVIQDEGGAFPINRGYIAETKAAAERWLKMTLKYLATPDAYGNYPYGGHGRPVKVISTRIYSQWEEQNRPTYIYDY